jgi:hypothetical protein
MSRPTHARPRGRRYEVVVGLEVHLALRTRTKLFCGCPTGDRDDGDPAQRPRLPGLPGGAPGRSAPSASASPGSLPVANARALELAVRFAAALGCAVPAGHRVRPQALRLPRRAQELPAQPARPAGGSGRRVELPGGRRIGIVRCHLEEDAGRLIHPPYADHSLVDLDRAGAPLVELVTAPDLRSGEEARAFLEEVRAIARALDVSDATPEEGRMRADVNVSVRVPGEPLGTKVEVKNLNSFKSVQAAIESETCAPDAAAGRRANGAAGDPRLERGRAEELPCAPRRRRPTTATSTTPTSRRSPSTPPGWRRPRRHARDAGRARRRYRADGCGRRRRPAGRSTSTSPARSTRSVAAAAGRAGAAAAGAGQLAARRGGRLGARRRPRRSPTWPAEPRAAALASLVALAERARSAAHGQGAPARGARGRRPRGARRGARLRQVSDEGALARWVDDALAAHAGGGRRRARAAEGAQLPDGPGHEGEPRAGAPRRGPGAAAGAVGVGAVGARRHYAVDVLARRHFEQSATLAGIDAASAATILDDVRERVPVAIERVIAQVPPGTPEALVASIVSAIRTRAAV